MWKIALSGMKGRKKDTFLLSLVIALSFIFIITSTVFHESSQKTKLNQRIAMFGSWDAAYLKGNESIYKELMKLEDVYKLGVSRIVGNSESFGTVATINNELEEIGHFQMYEGRMPESENEIAIEVSQLGKFTKEIKVGDTIPVEVKITLFDKSENEVFREAIFKLIPRKDRPSYGLELDYGMKSTDIQELVDRLKRIDGVSRVELYKAGERAYFWYSGITTNHVFSKFKETLPIGTRKVHFGTNDLNYSNLVGKKVPLVRDAIAANIYGIDVEDSIYDRFENALDIGSLNKEKFALGEEVIVMMPIYKEINNQNSSIIESIEDIISNTNSKNRMGILLKTITYIILLMILDIKKCMKKMIAYK